MGDGDYQAWNNGGSTPVYKILVYNFWEYMTAATPLEPNFQRGFPANAPIDPLVWGGLYAESNQGLQSLALIKWTSTLVFLGIIFAGNLLPQNPFIDDSIIAIIGCVLFGIAILLPVYCERKLKQDMQKAVKAVNRILHGAGYHVEYEITKTGVLYSAEHRFYIFCSPKGPSVQDMLPPIQAAMPDEPAKVYMHAPWYRHWFLWRCDWKRHDFFEDEQPAALRAIHPYIWGSLCDAFHSHELDELREKRERIINYAIALAVFSFFAIRDNRPWWIPVTLLLLAAVVAFFFFEHLLAKVTKKIGHDKWIEAVASWKRVMEPLGWQMEYHHKDESDETWRAKILFGGYPSDFIRFVPIHV